MILYRCDLCGQTRECLQKEIDGREYDICVECWAPLDEKLKGKGRAKKRNQTVTIPEPPAREEPEPQQKPAPGEPPKIWYQSDNPTVRQSKVEKLNA